MGVWRVKFGTGDRGFVIRIWDQNWDERLGLGLVLEIQIGDEDRSWELRLQVGDGDQELEIGILQFEWWMRIDYYQTYLRVYILEKNVQIKFGPTVFLA